MQEEKHDNFRALFSEINPLFLSSAELPNTVRLRIRMQGFVDPEILRHAVDRTMQRYPYFCVRLVKRQGQWGFVHNPLPVVISSNPGDAVLNSESSNGHLIAFSCREDWLYVEFSHCLTDGTGAYELLRTLLYYYCTESYHVPIDPEGIRLTGDCISQEEWDDPALRITDDPPEGGGEVKPCLDLVSASGLENDTLEMVYSISIDEMEFMRFNIQNDGSPATMIALFLSRAIAAVHPDCRSPIRISLCVNQRKALQTPLAHQSLVGGAWLEYKDRMRDLPLTTQATMYRGMVMVQTREESVLSGLTYINRNARRLLAMGTDEERAREAAQNRASLRGLLTATVSYTGKGNLSGAEKYIREIHTWANAMNENLLIEISAINGSFTIDCVQNFSSPVYWNMFLRQLEENGIAFKRHASMPLALPAIRLPWIDTEAEKAGRTELSNRRSSPQHSGGNT